ncbi:MAG: tRNA-dihydrouridine synthase [Planctomycetes bacterium]|nr:tRNA-dihydrouridine synthase [Planctomycetota bacterium]
MPTPPAETAALPPPAARRAPLRIGRWSFDLPAVQAALSGYSDLPMRRMARSCGAPYALHEVVLDRLVLEPGRLQRELLAVPADDHPVGGQLMGADPATFARAARALVDAGFDVVDLNFGCPVPKVLGRSRGGFLLGEPDTALRMVAEVLQAVGGDVPVSIKMRRGLDDSAASERRFFRILDGALALGIAAVTVHPRTVAQRYEGPSDWSFLRRVRAAVSGAALLGSGDLFGPLDVVRMLDETGVDGVTIARGCIGNPWIFGQVRDLLDGRAPRAPTLAEQRAMIERHYAESIAWLGPKKGPGRARTHAIKYAALHPDGRIVRDTLAAARDEAALRDALERHYPASRAAESAPDPQALAHSAQQLRGCGID